MMWRQVSLECLGPRTQVLLLFLLSPNQEQLSERDEGLALLETCSFLWLQDSKPCLCLLIICIKEKK